MRQYFDFKPEDFALVPEGESGDWSLRHEPVTEEQAKFDRLRGLMGGHGRYVPAGTYMRLTRNHTPVMTNTPDEIRDHLDLWYEARGHVLMFGLGLGVAVQIVARARQPVERITVVERSTDVIRLVGPTLLATVPQLELIEGDAFEFKPPKGYRFGSVWVDIWDTICGDHWDEMKWFTRRYCRRADWVGCWNKYLMRRLARGEG